MSKEFYTERDIEDMAKQGERSLIVNDNVVLTDLAYEKARRLGIELIQQNETPPAAPIRPYISKTIPKTKPAPSALRSSSKLDTIKKNVKDAVRSQLGKSVSDELLERIIDRVASELGLR